MPMNKEDFQRVRSLFPQSLQAPGVQQAHLLKEYLEVQALQFISTHPLSAKMVFIGGTNLRILKGINRFSENLDFDVKDMSREEFTVLTDDLLRYLNMIGWNATPKSSESGKLSVFQRSIYFPELLYQLDLSPHKEERFMMKIKAQDQGVNYTAENKLVRKYGTPLRIATPSDEVLLAMKFCALLNRSKGRDLYDIAFLMSNGIVPDMNFVQRKRPEIGTLEELYAISIEVLETVDLMHKAKDVEHLLINPMEKQNIFFLPAILKDELEQKEKVFRAKKRGNRHYL